MYYCSHCGASVSGEGRCPCCGVLLVGNGGAGSEASKASLRRAYLKKNSILYNIWLCIRRVFLIAFGLAGFGMICCGIALVFYNPPFLDCDDVGARIFLAFVIMAFGWAFGKCLFKE